MMNLPTQVLFLTSELFPQWGYPTAGGGVRAAQIYSHLVECGYKVRVGILDSSLSDKTIPSIYDVVEYAPQSLTSLIEKENPDLVISEGWEPLSHVQFNTSRLYFADCPGPLFLERSFDKDPSAIRKSLMHKVRTLSNLDGIFCANAPTRHYLSAFLSLAGWQPSDQSIRMCHLPIALPEVLHQRNYPSSDFEIFVGGIAWNWQSSYSWITELADELEERGFGFIKLRTGTHPVHMNHGNSSSIPESLTTHPRIRFGPLVNWQSLILELSSIPVAVDWSPLHIEREIASTIRLVTLLGCGVPIILRSHLDLAREIRDWKAGWVVDDWQELIQLLDDLHNNPGLLSEYSDNALKLSSQSHSLHAKQNRFSDYMNTVSSSRIKQMSVLQFVNNYCHDLEIQRAQLLDSEANWRKEQASLNSEIQRLNQELSTRVSESEAYRSLRQKWLYRLWKRLIP